MPVRVDFLGTARGRTRVSHITLAAQPLEGILNELRNHFPKLGEILPSAQFKGFVLISRNGQDFISDPNETIKDGETLLIIGADAGG